MTSLNKVLSNKSPKYWRADFFAGIAVFLTAIPLCLGIALSSGAPAISGIISGIIGGVVVGSISNSHTSVSGPAAGNIAVILAAIESMGSFRGVLLSIMIAGIMQIILSSVSFGRIMHFIPSSVTSGLLGAIGIIIIIKQVPYLLGNNNLPPERIMGLSEYGVHEVLLSLGSFLSGIDWSIALIGLVSIVIMFTWPKHACKLHRRLNMLPAPVVVVLVGTGMAVCLQKLFGYQPDKSVFVSLPVWQDMSPESLKDIVLWPVYQDITDLRVYVTGITIGIIASIETLLNIGATDKLDLYRRHTDPNREMLAQGVGNVLCGMFGALPVTSVIMRSTVGINSGAKSKRMTIFHGLLLIICVALLPHILNTVPLACLAGILIATGYKLVHIPSLREIYNRGRNQFIPFVITVIAIIATDLLIGVIMGIIAALYFAFRNLRETIVVSREGYHSAAEVLRIELAPHMSFIKKHALAKCLDNIPANSKVFIDARYVEYLDYDISSLIREFRAIYAPINKVKVELLSPGKKYEGSGSKLYVSSPNLIVTEKMLDGISADDVLDMLKNGNIRFLRNMRLRRNLVKQMAKTAAAQYPVAVVLGCIDSRTSAELIFDLGFGDVFSIRIAGNIINDDIIGNLEFACSAGAKLILVLGHTRCGAITAACNQVKLGGYFGASLKQIREAIAMEENTLPESRDGNNEQFIDNVGRINVQYARDIILNRSKILREMHDRGEIKVIGSIFDIASGVVDFLD